MPVPHRFTSREWVGELDVPATVLVHTDDRLVPPHRQRRLADALPDAHIAEIAVNHLARGQSWPTYVAALTRAHESVARRAGGSHPCTAAA